MFGAARRLLFDVNPENGAATWALGLNSTTPPGPPFVIADSHLSFPETRPTALTVVDGRLYYTGLDTARLYSNNLTGPIAFAEPAVAAEPAGFSIGEILPTGFTIHDEELMLVGQSNSQLDTIDRPTGRAIRQPASRLVDFGIGEDLPTAIVSSTPRSGKKDPVTLPPDPPFPYDTDLEASFPFNPSSVRASFMSRNRFIGSVGGAFALYESGQRSILTNRIGSATAFGVNETRPVGLAELDGQTYMLGDSNNQLYKHRGDGEFIHVSGETPVQKGFNVGELLPTDLASIGTTLYMVGQTNAALYTLDRDTGIATRVGSATAFGVGETQPTGLASITAFGRSTLYMVGQTNNVLYTVSTTTGIATRVGTATNFRAGTQGTPRLPTGLAVLGLTPRLFMVSQLHGELELLDTTTGESHSVGASIPTLRAGFNVGETQPTGLAAVNLGRGRYTLYMVGDIRNALYRIGLTLRSGLYTTSGATRIGTSFRFGQNEGLPTGLASIGTTLYMVGQTNAALYTLSSGTGVAVTLGGTTIPVDFGVGETSPFGLAPLKGNLYMLGRTNRAFYTLSVDTGIATKVADTTVTAGLGLVAFDQDTFYYKAHLGMVSSDGSSVTLIDPDTGGVVGSKTITLNNDSFIFQSRTLLGAGSRGGDDIGLCGFVRFNNAFHPLSYT